MEIKCLRCNTKMVDARLRHYHQLSNFRWSPTYKHITQMVRSPLFLDITKDSTYHFETVYRIDAMRCPNCGHVELFANDEVDKSSCVYNYQDVKGHPEADLR